MAVAEGISAAGLPGVASPVVVAAAVAGLLLMLFGGW